ncbi:MAG: U32 family peptidase [Clostridia bacterium]|nr:U32 family peptidase [Clostridia bacterium]
MSDPKVKSNKRVELLAPAGNMERLITAIHFGADAVYLGTTAFSLRNMADNFTLDEVREAVSYAHERGVKIYVTVNAFMRDSELESLPETLKALEDAGVDALIINDPSVVRIAKRVAPKLALHLSTQANTLNSEAALFWHEQGIERIVLARELTLSEIRTMREKLPASLELEAFVHGAMCVSYSGRCLLSNYIAGRDSNRGECVQPCRWSYEVRELGSNGEYFTLISEKEGSFIMNSRDMCMAEHLNELIDSGIISLKIEGRMKSILYVATVVNAYRMALDGADMGIVLDELNRISHRPYTTGFMLDDGAELMAEDSGGYIQDYRISAVVLDYNAETKIAHIEQRNRFFDGDVLSILSPGDVSRSFTVRGIRNEEGEVVTGAPHPCERLFIGCGEPLKPGDILRQSSDT